MSLPIISVSTNIVSEIDFNISRGRDANGYPVFDISSSGYLPKNLYIKTVIHPSGTPMDISYLSPLGTNRSLIPELISLSGYRVHDFTINTDSGVYNTIASLGYNWGNTYYQMAYYVENQNSYGEAVYPPQYHEPTGYYLSVAPRPQGQYTFIDSSISGNLQEQRLRLNVSSRFDINNNYLSDPAPYLITISGVDNYLTISGTNLPIGTSYNNDNYFTSAPTGIFLDLPFNSGTITGMPDEASVFDYNISLFNIDQLGVLSPPLVFNTKPFRLSSIMFDTGDVQAFNEYKILERQDNAQQLILPDTVPKKRFMIGIEDLGLIKTSYARVGSFVSDYYTIDDPIYTFSLKVNEWIPPVQQVNPYSIITYWVELGNGEWTRVSPTTRDSEIDSNGKVIPKLLILDNLEEGFISTEVKEVLLDAPIYTFRIKIDIDMSFATSDLFISPEVREYECHVTDKNSFFRS